MSPREVIYLTGPPATGKTTLVTRLRKACPTLRAFVYSEMLAEHVSRELNSNLSQEELRRKSAVVVSPSDVRAVDKQLLKSVRTARNQYHVLIDSHPVTKEDYGFRVTPFSVSLLRSLNPTRICMLFTHSQVVIKRIRRDPRGRPTVTPFEADFHCFSQVSVAITYGISLGIPVYFFDVSVGNEQAFQNLATRLS
jgi:adenylate kinase